ncbi:DNA topoisomerase IV subunit A [Spirochaetia bacterium]|nr:DNA topoisomerase IV subunit A [Spirochaetia bacterium]GHU32204.1 DNA topoisomerase IV subunit A [Spirochaetia bacterium]
MATVKNLFERNFLEYASYVIRDRAIPALDDGLKPVQRRILHSLFEMDDGKFHKVANVVGHCMQYHPHGDASIGGALVVLANKEFFIDRQGNFGNVFTGDEASAARYIECRATALAKAAFYNPKLTEMADSYDGRNREPVVFPAKIPAVLVMGAEGIAVGMSTKILPHNIIETLEAEKKCLRGESFSLFPDFPTGGLVDISDYKDGNGKILVRAKLDLSDSKRIVIRELPFGSTTETLINSIESAAKAGRIKIQSISDFTAEQVEIEIKLARGVYSQDTVDSLFAWTDCEQSISVNLLVIQDNLPAVVTITDIIRHHAAQLIRILTQELEIEQQEVQNEIRSRTLEKIFIENRIFEQIENRKTIEGIEQAVIAGFESFPKVLPVTKEDVERLLKIPIRRLSLYDSSKANAAVRDLNIRLKEINTYLHDITGYAIAFLDTIIEMVKKNPDYNHGNRKTIVGTFEKIDIKEVAKRDIQLKYDRETGYLGTAVAGEIIATVSSFDRILLFRNNGSYMVIEIPEKTFIGENAWWIGIADKEILAKTVWTIIYQESGFPYIKRCTIESWIMNREYPLLPDAVTVLHLDNRPNFDFKLSYTAKPRSKITEETFKAEDFPVKSLKAKALKLSNRESSGITIL